MPGLTQDGVLLEDSNELLPWGATFDELRSIGAPEERDAGLVWTDRVILGGTIATLTVSSSPHSGERFERCDVWLEAPPCESFAAAAVGFDESVRRLSTFLGKPGWIERPKPPYGPSMGGQAVWRCGEVRIHHTLTTPWDGWSNRTTIERSPASSIDDLRASVGLPERRGVGYASSSGSSSSSNTVAWVFVAFLLTLAVMVFLGVVTLPQKPGGGGFNFRIR